MLFVIGNEEKNWHDRPTNMCSKSFFVVVSYLFLIKRDNIKTCLALPQGGHTHSVENFQ